MCVFLLLGFATAEPSKNLNLLQALKINLIKEGVEAVPAQRKLNPRQPKTEVETSVKGEHLVHLAGNGNQGKYWVARKKPNGGLKTFFLRPGIFRFFTSPKLC